MCTACWVTDEFSLESGRHAGYPRHPQAPKPSATRGAQDLEGAQPIVAPKGSLVLWNGNVWHGNYPRQIDGERVVLHLTYTRVGFAPVEDYRHLGDDWLAGKPPELATLLGRDHFLGKSTIASGGAVGPCCRRPISRCTARRGY